MSKLSTNLLSWKYIALKTSQQLKMLSLSPKDSNHRWYGPILIFQMCLKDSRLQKNSHFNLEILKQDHKQ